MTDRRTSLLLQAFDSAPTSLSLCDASGRILGANLAFWKLFGYDPSDDLFVSDLSRTADQAWTTTYLAKLAAGEIEEFESAKRFVHSDGSEFDGRVTIRAFRHDGGTVGMIATVEPIEVRPMVEDAHIRKLLKHAAGTVTLLDADGRVLETSGRYRATLGYPREFWESRTILDILVDDDAERVLAMQNTVVSNPGHEEAGDFRVHAADGSIETLEVLAVNMLHDPSVKGIVLSSRNVTKERAESAALEKLRDDAVAEAERRSRLLATVSHELRNPLHAMSGMAELLASDSSVPSGAAKQAKTLYRQLIRLTDVTDDLLDTASIDGGHFEIRSVPVVVRNLVDDAVISARTAAGGRLTVTSTIADDVPHTISSDPTRLQQILGNLLGNAIKFTDEGSVDLSVQQMGTSIEFVVSDTGRGIPTADVGQVFQAFTTSATSGDQRGAGLGLAVVDRLVAALAGSIALDTEVGTGSTFRVTIPVESVAGSDAANSSIAAPAAAGRRPRILVVEDTPVNQELARAQLDHLHMDCIIADSAEDALELLDADRFDAILMDHQLPGMNGRDATREIRRRQVSTPVIGVTASSTAADERACLDAGMNAFLAKPVGLERLGAALADILATGTSAVLSAALGESEATAPTIDVTVLQGLADELGDRSIVDGLVATFLNELTTRSTDIVGDDPELASRQAHTLKSSARLLGAIRLSEACAGAEHDAEARHGIDELATAARVELQCWLAAADSPTPPGPKLETRP